MNHNQHRAHWRRLIKRSGLPPRVQQAALHISEYPRRGEPGVYCRTHDEIADDLRCGTATVERALRVAQGNGWLEVKQRGQKHRKQTYRLTIPGKAQVIGSDDLKAGSGHHTLRPENGGLRSSPGDDPNK